MLEQANDSYGIANDTRIIKKAVNLAENNKRLFIKDKPSFRRSLDTEYASRSRHALNLPAVSKSMVSKNGRLYNNSKAIMNRAEAQKLADQLIASAHNSFPVSS